MERTSPEKKDRNGVEAVLTEGHVERTLARLTLPMIGGILGMVAFNLTDTFFVSRLGTEPLAAISFTFPVVLVLNRIALGIGIGAAAVISQAVGRGDRRESRRLTTDSLGLVVIIAAVFVTAGIFSIDFLFPLLGAGEKILPLVKQYMRIWYAGLIFVVIPMVSGNAIRAHGDTKTPALIMLTSVLVNVIMDPLLIFGIGPFPEMGLEGAALATVFARAMAFFVTIYVIYFRRRMITFERPALREVADSWKRVLFIGVPAAATKIVMPMGMGVLTNIVSGYGAPAVAAFGVSMRVEFFALATVMALSTVMGPFVGQNLGADNFLRLKRGIAAGKRFSLIWGAGMFLVLAPFAGPIAGIFSSNPEVVGKIVLYIRIVALCYSFQGLMILYIAVLNVLHKPFHAASLGIAQMFLFAVPLAWAGSRLFGLTGVYAGIAAGNIIAGTAAIFVLKRVIIETRAKMSYNC